jgi:signal transduction histidine kinase
VHARIGNINEYYGDIFHKKEKEKADSFYNVALAENNIALEIWVKQKREVFKADVLSKIGNIYLKLGNKSLSKSKLDSALQLAKNYSDKQILSSIYYNLSRLDSALGNFSSAYENYKRYNLYTDSLNIDEDIRKVENLKLQNEFEQKEAFAKAEQDKKDAEARLKKYQQFFVLLGVVSIALILFVSNRRKQKANLLLQNEKQKVESTLQELKSTQAQLIQSEKMASLGELTAGIAHEIQNPLNFVNNFSEVNKEMLEELKAERLKPNADKTVEDDLINDLVDNSEKINHHGKRADAIVKNMLQHSRQTSGMKEPTDINALCDEYLRLSFHGMRAKNKDFNAEIKTDFDKDIGKINVVPQDIGRVLLNLFNNAFYAVNEKKKLLANSYQPIAEVKTRRTNDKVEIIVSDNGNGIPQNIIDKIFQPFFTTKPTGEGTGLGLSLAYDIITKEHNGTIRVESEDSEGTDFIVQLSII